MSSTTRRNVRGWRQLLTVLTGVSIVTAGTGAAAAAAAAAPHDPNDGSAVARTASVGLGEHDEYSFEHAQLTITEPKGPAPSDLATQAATIGCTLNVQHPHGSHHVRGTINGVARVGCTGPAGSLTLHYSLFRISPYAHWAAGAKTNSGKASIQNSRAVSCGEGPADFQGWAMGVITPPPGYTLVGPPEEKAFGATVSVACGIPLRAATAEETIIEFEFIRNDLAIDNQH